MVQTAVTLTIDPSSAAVIEPRAGALPRRRTFLRALVGVGAALTVPGTGTPAPGGPTAGVAFSQPNGAAIQPEFPPAAAHSTASAADRIEWRRYRERFITAEGRAVDTGNGGVSHSEGQGYAMLLAEWAEDRGTFERLLTWTRTHLARPTDSLIAWHFDPRQQFPVPDHNSATDGDIAVAWALRRAGDRWAVPEWSRLAQTMARDILRLSVCEVAGRTVLLPGAQGFERTDRVILNPSYYNLPGIRSLARLVPDPAWLKLETDSHWLLGCARFGRWGLPADWIEIMRDAGTITTAAGHPPRFSWDAVRVPMFLIWAGRADALAVTAAAAFWSQGHASVRAGAVPAWTDFRGDVLAPYAGHAGITAVAAMSVAAQSGNLATAHVPSVNEASDYYAAALIMLTRIARQEAQLADAPRRVLASAR